ncbi:MAG: S41 family peptidase [Alistipes sp.]|nr:S41 family peptidase [Alistipes sp.]
MKRLLISTIGFIVTAFSASAQLTEQQQIQKLNYVYQYLRNNYVDELSLEPLVEKAIIATLKELDPHSSYLTREEMQLAKSDISGEYAGVGIQYILHNDTIVISNTVANSPAERAGLRPNDRIIAINNRSAIGITSDSVPLLIKGKVGSKITLRIARGKDRSIFDTELKRNNIDISAIAAAYRFGDVGYIHISRFSKPVAAEFLAAYNELGKVKSLIIDLRNNPGGALTSAIDLSTLFLNKGDIVVSTEGHDNTLVYDCKRDGRLCEIPLVVLINENSASASEIFAGAIQDHDRGIVVGRTSFGKGLVQRLIELADGSAIKVTTARYKTPTGRTIQRPYTMGNDDDYWSDRRHYMHPDSIVHNEALLFKTLKIGRTVYGGGGITPDIYIPLEEIALSAHIAQVIDKELYKHAVIEFWDSVPMEDILKQYPTVDEFESGYAIESRLWEIYYTLASYNPTEDSEIDRHYIEVALLAAMAEQLYGSDARYYIHIVRLDSLFKQAITIAQDEDIIQKGVCGILEF